MPNREPLMQIAFGESEDPPLSMNELRPWLKAEVYGRTLNPQRIRSWIKERGFPAIENPFRLDRSGKPTYLFEKKKVLAWFRGQFKQVNEPQEPEMKRA